MSKKLSVQDLMAIPDATDELLDIEVPGYGEITVRAISLAEHRQMREEAFKGDSFDEGRWYTLLLQFGVVEPELTFDQAASMAKKRVGLVDDILAAILRISGLTRAGTVSKEAVDESEESFRQG
jgi:hypothetical protein